jgi:hypothetical protein
LSYMKDDEKKIFNVPAPTNQAKQTLYNYLLTKTYKHEVSALTV